MICANWHAVLFGKIELRVSVCNINLIGFFMSLRPDETIQKMLISTTSKLVGECKQDNVLFTHANYGLYDKSARVRMDEGPNSRQAFVVCFRTEPLNRISGGIVPEYAPIGKGLVSYLSVLYGKRFDYHGLIESIGMFFVPDLSEFNVICNSVLPHNTHFPRVDFSISLSLSEVERIGPILSVESLDKKFLTTFKGAAKFYWQALQNFESDPEIAYLHLITAGEILSGFHEFDKQDLLDESMRSAIERISVELEDGVKVANQITSRLLQVKKRFVKTLVGFVDQSFFERSESREEIGRFDVESFCEKIGAAYDLRSNYVHTGKPFGQWVSSRHNNMNHEVQIYERYFEGDSESKKIGRIIFNAPTLVGLERVMRYCLLSFAKKHGGLVEI